MAVAILAQTVQVLLALAVIASRLPSELWHRRRIRIVLEDEEAAVKRAVNHRLMKAIAEATTVEEAARFGSALKSGVLPEDLQLEGDW